MVSVQQMNPAWKCMPKNTSWNDAIFAQMSKSCIWNHLATLKVLGLCKHIHTLCVCVWTVCMYICEFHYAQVHGRLKCTFVCLFIHCSSTGEPWCIQEARCHQYVEWATGLGGSGQHPQRLCAGRWWAHAQGHTEIDAAVGSGEVLPAHTLAYSQHSATN